MKPKAVFIGIILSIIFVFSSNAQQGDFPILKGLYLGQKPPGITPEVFAPDILPPSNFHSTTVFTPDGKEVYWKMMKTNKISMMKFEDNVWSTPKEMTLSPMLSDFRDPVLSPDGKTMFFLSKGKLSYQQLEKENIWYVKRIADGWSDPQPLNEGINSHTLHWQVSVASNGNLYFMSRNEDGFEDIYYSQYYQNDYQNPVKLSEAINTEEHCETTPFISPDENYIIFSRWDLTDEKGLMQLYISFRNNDGNWNQAKKIEKIKWGVCPQVSFDNKYIFFMSLIDGQIRIMWADVTIIEELKPNELK